MIYPPLYIFFLVYPIYIFGENLYKSAKDVSGLSEALIHKRLMYPWMCPAASGKGSKLASRMSQGRSNLRGMEGQTAQAGNQVYYINILFIVLFTRCKKE